jgi:hypothetical protein
MKRPLRRGLGHLGQQSYPVRQPIGCRTTLFACTVAIGVPVLGCAQSGPPSGPPPGVMGYALVYEDSFSTDPSNANGELQNILKSSSAPLRPDWTYREGTTADCSNTAASTNVFLAPSFGGVQALVLRDIASTPASANVNHFPTGSQQAYQTYTCGGIISTRRLGFGYYESYALLNVSTPTPGFHTSFWTYNSGGYHVNETDVFEHESIDNYTGVGFNSGIFAWNPVGGAQNPSPHPYTAWGGSHGAYNSPHAFGVLISPTNYQFYLDGFNLSSATARTAGPYVATEVWLTSVGSLHGTPYKITNSAGPCIQYDGTHSTLNYDYTFRYFKYYQQTNAQALRAQALPPGSIFIDPTIPSGGYNGSTFSAGDLTPYLSYPYNGNGSIWATTSLDRTPIRVAEPSSKTPSPSAAPVERWGAAPSNCATQAPLEPPHRARTIDACRDTSGASYTRSL